MKKINIRWQLVFYDISILAAVEMLLLFFYKGSGEISYKGMFYQFLLTAACVFTARFIGQIYAQIWRYGGIQCYIKLLITDGVAFIINLFAEMLLPENISVTRLLSISCMNLLGALSMRMMYRYAYKYGRVENGFGKVLNLLLRIFAGAKVEYETRNEYSKIKIAIIGAGSTGVALAEELLNNVSAAYSPRCFVDINKEKVARKLHDLPVFPEDEAIFERLKEMEIQEVVFALPHVDEQRKKQLYEYYINAGYKIKLYDVPVIETADKKAVMREFDIEDLLFRKPIIVQTQKSKEYYKDKVILITGGGGSIGSELTRQLATLRPKRIILLDIYENGAYDVQQELRIAYGNKVDIKVEICSICNVRALERVFEEYRPQILINAAAHKHVPFMEKNCIEAVENNVFGTVNLIELCERYSLERFIMVSTDKAVNPTNVMGATKRMCEMLVLCASRYGKVKYSITRFGNVLGSAGSVIPLFKKQIASGGPVTVTDKRIIRYFMTIPEASQLVLQSGAMANNGELFVLDMGQPVKILDLAQNMIRLSGMKGVEIIETGLRPGEKLYEELLVNTDVLEKTENSLIFIERDAPKEKGEIEQKLSLLKQACDSGDNSEAKKMLHLVVSGVTDIKVIEQYAVSERVAASMKA